MTTERIKLDRDGTFKAVPYAWGIYVSRESAVALCVDYEIIGQQDGSEWIDWSSYGPYEITGYHWVIKKDGSPSDAGIGQAVDALGWNGDLDAVNGPPPKCIVQLNVRSEEYNGKISFKVDWLNPGDFEPSAKHADPETFKKVKAQFGSALRAAAGARAKKNGVKPAPRPAPTPRSTPPAADNSAAEDEAALEEMDGSKLPF